MDWFPYDRELAMKELKERSHYENHTHKKNVEVLVNPFLLAAFQQKFHLGWELGVIGFRALPP